ncbi:hypothetical protein AVEN_168455-1, partial [Araneus ventricosus]
NRGEDKQKANIPAESANEEFTRSSRAAVRLFSKSSKAGMALNANAHETARNAIPTGHGN